MDATMIVRPPHPGVYDGVPPELYHRWPAASNSALGRLLRSPAHMRAYLDGEYKDTPALIEGRAIHTAVLEPDAFAGRYTVAEQCQAKKKDGDRCSNGGLMIHRDIGWVCGVHGRDPKLVAAPEAEVLAQADRDRILAIRDSVMAHPAARALVTGPGQVELSLAWRDRETGVLCKGRWDRHTPELGGGAIVDLKTTTDAGRAAFEKSIFKFGYHRQAAFYLMGAKARKIPVRSFAIIAVEKEPPYGVAVYRISDAVVQDAQEQVGRLLRLYKQCKETGEYPGYPEGVQDISIPAWAWSQIADQNDELDREVA